jgi:hypothetical protein
MQQIHDLDPWLSAMYQTVDMYFLRNPETKVYHFKLPERFRAIWDDKYLQDRINDVYSSLHDIENEYDIHPSLTVNNVTGVTKIWVVCTTREGAVMWDEDTERPTENPLGFAPRFLR